MRHDRLPASENRHFRTLRTLRHASAVQKPPADTSAPAVRTPAPHPSPNTFLRQPDDPDPAVSDRPAAGPASVPLRLSFAPFLFPDTGACSGTGLASDIPTAKRLPSAARFRREPSTGHNRPPVRETFRRPRRTFRSGRQTPRAQSAPQAVRERGRPSRTFPAGRRSPVPAGTACRRPVRSDREKSGSRPDRSPHDIGKIRTGAKPAKAHGPDEKSPQEPAGKFLFPFPMRADRFFDILVSRNSA